MSQIDEIFVRRRGKSGEVALLTQGRLVELRLDQAAHQPGAVIVGRVETPAPDNAALFVDIGAPRAGFLRQVDMIGAAQDRPAPGDPVLVQIARAAGAGKGARLSMKLALPGRFVVLRPQETGVAISERIADDGVRGRLGVALADLAAEAGLTVRTAAADADPDLLRADALRLAQLWDGIRARALSARPPQILSSPDDPLAEAVREHGHRLARLAVAGLAGRRQAEMLRELHGDAFAIEVLADESAAFDQYDIDAQIEQALAPEVALPGGGSISIEPTRAFTAVDVDAGAARQPLAVNLEAAEVVAQQLRLRNIGGAVLVDFIDMRSSADRDRVLGRLALHLAEDPLPTQALGWTRLGLAEVMRARRGLPLAQLLQENSQ